MTRLLVIEDDPAILRGLVDHLTSGGYEVQAETDGLAGYKQAVDTRPSLIVLDLMLPMISGYEVCRRLRKEGIQIPILMLTSRAEEFDRVAGLDLGADDYVTKPFSVLELSARIRALLRRGEVTNGSLAAAQEVRFGDVSVNFAGYEVSRGGQIVEMTRKELQVLRFLISRAGQVVTREDLLEEVWGMDHFPTTRTVDNHVASLRSKLETKPAKPRHIITVHGVGYRFDVGN